MSEQGTSEIVSNTVDANEDESETVREPRSVQSRGEKTAYSRISKPKSYEDKQRQLLLADCNRLKKTMTETRDSIERPPLKPFTPYLFNSLEPYYNQYLVKYTVNELKSDLAQEERPVTTYGQRATSLGIVEPQKSWKMDNVPGPFSFSRLSGNLSGSKRSSSTLTGKDPSLGSTRLPPFPKPIFPKFKVPEYQALKMDYSQVLKFRIEMDREIDKLNEKKEKTDYNRTLKDWERMNLQSLKELPPYSRYHVNKAVKTYFSTSKGGAKAVNTLSKQLEVE